MNDRMIVNPEANNQTAGFRTTETGLLVPESVAREVETWTPDEWNLLERAAKMLVEKGLLFRVYCAHPSCRTETDIAMVEMTATNEGRVLRCPHKDRSLVRADLIRGQRMARAEKLRENRMAKRRPKE